MRFKNAQVTPLRLQFHKETDKDFSLQILFIFLVAYHLKYVLTYKRKFWLYMRSHT